MKSGFDFKKYLIRVVKYLVYMAIVFFLSLPYLPLHPDKKSLITKVFSEPVQAHSF